MNKKFKLKILIIFLHLNFSVIYSQDCFEMFTHNSDEFANIFLTVDKENEYYFSVDTSLYHYFGGQPNLIATNEKNILKVEVDNLGNIWFTPKTNNYGVSDKLYRLKDGEEHVFTSENSNLSATIQQIEIDYEGNLLVLSSSRIYRQNNDNFEDLNLNIEVEMIKSSNNSIWLLSDNQILEYRDQVINQFSTGIPETVILEMTTDNNGDLWTLNILKVSCGMSSALYDIYLSKLENGTWSNHFLTSTLLSNYPFRNFLENSSENILISSFYTSSKNNYCLETELESLNIDTKIFGADRSDNLFVLNAESVFLCPIDHLQISNSNQINQSNYPINIHPNPFENFIKIENKGNQLISKIEIFNSTMTKVWQQKNQSQTNLINVSLPSGFYIMQITFVNGKILSEIILGR